ncbi:MAG: hypothetical protein A3K67_03355 [Euryarchaeota archaeon RBG_16_62_10]|nr:MAG: hypothetical protein A3K67_03355 [Euryarchaeota archaeon RBG_16_62_10]
MKVAMLTYSTRPRGGVVHALKLAERLRALGTDVTLYSLARADDPLASGGYFRPVSVPFEVFRYDWTPELVTRLERMISSYSDHLPRDADVYHAQDCVGGTALARMKAEGIIAAPVFRTIHHVDDFAEPRLFEFEKAAVAASEHRFVVSRYWKDRLESDYGLDSTIAYNGFDQSDFADLPPKRSTRPTILFVGGLEPRKGLEFLIHALEPVASAVPEVRLVAIGKSGFRGTDEWGWFLTLAARLGVRERLEFHESVPQETLLQLYSDCDVLVMPSRTEGWGLALMEAMACGKPIVASRTGGIPELVRDGVDGLLVPPGDVKGIADAVTRLLSDPGLGKAMGARGMERVKEFTWDGTARTVLREYERAIHRP